MENNPNYRISRIPLVSDENMTGEIFMLDITAMPTTVDQVVELLSHNNRLDLETLFIILEIHNCFPNADKINDLFISYIDFIILFQKYDNINYTFGDLINEFYENKREYIKNKTSENTKKFEKSLTRVKVNIIFFREKFKLDFSLGIFNTLTDYQRSQICSKPVIY